MKKTCLSVCLLLCIGLSLTAQAQQEAAGTLAAIVEVRITVPKNAPSAERFGTNRVASGVVIDESGHVLTIGFQTLDAAAVEVVRPDGKMVDAAVVAYDHDTGLGLLRTIVPLQVTPLALGNSAEVKNGDPVLAASYGGDDAVKGVMVIAVKEFAGPWEYLLENAIFTAPAIENFSGAALINRTGRLVGIGYLLSQFMLPELGLVQTNMFVPVDILKPILSDLILSGKSKRPPRPWLGVRTEESHGRLFVERVVPGGPSEKAEIKTGDIILAVGKEAVQGMADFYRKVWALGDAGVDVPLTVLQGIAIRNVTVQSARRNPEVLPQRKDTHAAEQL